MLDFHLQMRLHYETVKDLYELGPVCIIARMLNGIVLDKVRSGYFEFVLL